MHIFQTWLCTNKHSDSWIHWPSDTRTPVESSLLALLHSTLTSCPFGIQRFYQRFKKPDFHIPKNPRSWIAKLQRYTTPHFPRIVILILPPLISLPVSCKARPLLRRPGDRQDTDVPAQMFDREAWPAPLLPAAAGPAPPLPSAAGRTRGPAMVGICTCACGGSGRSDCSTAAYIRQVQRGSWASWTETERCRWKPTTPCWRCALASHHGCCHLHRVPFPSNSRQHGFLRIVQMDDALSSDLDHSTKSALTPSILAYAPSLLIPAAAQQLRPWRNHNSRARNHPYAPPAEAHPSRCSGFLLLLDHGSISWHILDHKRGGGGAATARGGR